MLDQALFNAPLVQEPSVEGVGVGEWDGGKGDAAPVHVD